MLVLVQPGSDFPHKDRPVGPDREVVDDLDERKQTRADEQTGGATYRD